MFNIFENDFDSLGISFAQCLSYMLAAGSHNDRTACWFLGFCYEYGLGVEVDLELSITYYKACLKEDSYWEKDFDLFAYWNYFNLCERINGETNVEIYNIYKEGLIVCEYGEDEAIQDVNDGKKFIQIAHTELSTSKATHSLFRGLYVFRRVFLFFFAQAAAGEVDAITRLGECYMNGIGVEKSKEKAHYYSQMALEQKNMLFHDN